MFVNFLKVAFRNLTRNWFYVLINILGLGLALSVSIVAYLNHQYDADFDKGHTNGKEIYKIEITRETQGRQQQYGISPMALRSQVGENISGISSIMRFARSWSPLKVGLKNFNKSFGYVDPEFLENFSFPMVSGSAASLYDRQNILISEGIADIYFGQEEEEAAETEEAAIGKIMSVFNDAGKEFTYTVGGVFETLPLNSSFSFSCLSHIDNYMDMFNVDETNWKVWVAGTFIRIPDKTQVKVVEGLLQDYVAVQNKAREDFRVSGYYLVPLEDMAHHAWDVWSNQMRQSFHPAAVTAPPFMALFILLLACFNFTNTAIAFSGKRLKEIGVRKVVGGDRRSIIIQFMSENALLSFLGLVFAVIFGGYLVSTYSSMWEYMELTYSFKQYPGMIVFLLFLFVLTVIMAGAYPAFYISRFNPVYIFQDKLKIGGRNYFSIILLTLQFGIAVLSLISGVIFTQNAYFQDNQYLGYDKDHIIGLNINNRDQFVAFRDRIRTNPKVLSIGESDEHIGQGGYVHTMKYEGVKSDVQVLDIGSNYINTMGVRLVSGRDFEDEFEETDRAHSIIVNKKFISEFSVQDPIGKRILMNDTVPLHIIGVVEDFYPYGFWNEIEPLVFRRATGQYLRYLTVKANTEDLAAVNEYLENEWMELIPNVPYGGFYQDSLMDEARQINKNIKNIYLFLGFIALFLSAVGLYTMVSLSVLRRTKEIGVRKVMGATISQITGILSRPYAIIIAIACIIGLSGGYYSSLAIMDSIWEVHTRLNALSYILPVVIIFVLAAASIGGKVYGAAARNPTDSLRYE